MYQRCFKSRLTPQYLHFVLHLCHLFEYVVFFPKTQCSRLVFFFITKARKIFIIIKKKIIISFLWRVNIFFYLHVNCYIFADSVCLSDMFSRQVLRNIRCYVLSCLLNLTTMRYAKSLTNQVSYLFSLWVNVLF